MRADDYHPSTSSSDNCLWKASKVHTICQNTSHKNQLFLIAFHQNLTHLEKEQGHQKDLDAKQCPSKLESSKFPLILAF